MTDRFPSASFFKERVAVFNIKGNEYRIEAQISFKIGVVRVPKAGTHPEYDRWKHERRRASMARVIHTTAEHETALVELDRLMELDPDPGTAEADDLELLALLVETYEKERFPIAPPDPVEAIRFRMEQAGLRQKDLVPYLGSKSRVSEVLSGKRPLTLAMIRALHEGLGIPAEVLLRRTPDAGSDADPDAGSQDDEATFDGSRMPVKEAARRG